MATRQRLPGVALLADYLARHELSRAEFARRTDAGPTRVDRVTVAAILNGHAKRISAGVALAIERATEGEVPVGAWEAAPAPVRKTSGKAA